jgi:hypothetical protein
MLGAFTQPSGAADVWLPSNVDEEIAHSSTSSTSIWTESGLSSPSRSQRCSG